MGGATARKSNTTLDLLTGVTGLGVLFAALLVLDQRLRVEVSHVFMGQGLSADLTGPTARAGHALSVAAGVLRDQSLSYAPLTVFGVAALILVLFMTRT